MAYRGHGGFTVIEALMILAIIGILAAIIIPQVFYRSTDAANKSARNVLRNAMTAQEVCFVNEGSYTGDVLVLINGYGFKVPDKVVFTIVRADKEGYEMEAYHMDGDKTYIGYGPDGEIQIKE